MTAARPGVRVGFAVSSLTATALSQLSQPQFYHVVDNEWSMREYGSQAVVWQTGVNPIVALELLDSGAWTGSGVLGPEAFDAVPFLDLLAGDYASPWGQREMSPA
jgi:saccharopine dehydrogenase-like NADP-dependent oxidoreductase